MWWNRRFASRMWSWQIFSKYMMLRCQYGPKSQDIPAPCWIYEKLRQLWKQRGPRGQWVYGFLLRVAPSEFSCLFASFFSDIMKPTPGPTPHAVFTISSLVSFGLSSMVVWKWSITSKRNFLLFVLSYLSVTVCSVLRSGCWSTFRFSLLIKGAELGQLRLK